MGPVNRFLYFFFFVGSERSVYIYHIVNQTALPFRKNDCVFIVVRPVIRITNFEGHMLQFSNCFFFCRFSHPIQSVYTIFIGGQNLMDQRFDILLILFRKMLFYIKPAELKSKCILDKLSCQLFIRFLSLNSLLSIAPCYGAVPYFRCQTRAEIFNQAENGVILQQRQMAFCQIAVHLFGLSRIIYHPGIKTGRPGRF